MKSVISGAGRLSIDEFAVLTIRNARDDDLEWLLALNNAAVPEVNELALSNLKSIVAMASIARIADDDDRPVGAVICLSPDADYGSEYYRWIDDRYRDFLYVDRVIVDAGGRGRGVAQALYRSIEASTIGLASRLTCEVNELPPNPQSLRFHQRFGFRAVGRRSTQDGRKRVLFLVKDLAS